MAATCLQKESARHRFSVLLWFLDCRDAVACRYQWEDCILKYFGAGLEDGDESDFDKFAFEPKAQFRAGESEETSVTA